MPAVFLNPPQGAIRVRVIVVTNVAGATRVVVCHDGCSFCVDEDVSVCSKCPSFVENSCTALPGDTCTWGTHADYNALTEFQQEAAHKSSYLKSVFTPEGEVKQES